MTHKTSKFISIALLMILTVDIVIEITFSDWSISSEGLYIIHCIARNVFFTGFIISLLYSLKLNKVIMILVSSFFVLGNTINIIGVIHPFDTTSFPKDIKTLKDYENGRKLIVRQAINAKTNQIITDSIIVNDFLWFRKTFSDSVLYKPKL